MVRQQKKGKDLTEGDVSEDTTYRKSLVKLYGLIALLAITLVFIGLLEWAHHALPTQWRNHFNPADQQSNTTSSMSIATSSGFFMPDSLNALSKRQTGTFITGNTPGNSPTPAPTTTTPVPLSGGTCAPYQTNCGAGTIFVPPSSTSTIPTTSCDPSATPSCATTDPPSGVITTTTLVPITTTDPPGSTPLPTTDPTPTPSPSPTPSAPSAVISPNTSAPAPSITPTVPPLVPVVVTGPTTSTPVTTANVPPAPVSSSVVSTNVPIPLIIQPSTTIIPFVTLSTTINSNGQVTAIPVTSSMTLTPDVSIPVASIAQPATTPGQSSVASDYSASAVTPNTNSIVFVVASSQTTGSDGLTRETSATVMAVLANPSLTRVTNTNGQVFTVPPVIPTSTSSGPRSSNTASSTSVPGDTEGNTNSSNSALVPVVIYSLPSWRIFVGGYLPIMIALSYNMAWRSLHLYSEWQAPWDRLRGAAGASARRLYGGLTASSAITLAPAAVAWLIVPFSADLMYFDTDYGCPNPDVDNPYNPCWPPKMTANGWVIRLLQALLALAAVMTIGAIISQLRKPHNAQIDPTSIAAISSVAGHPQLARDFSAVPAELTNAQMEQMLKQNTYHLGEYQDVAGVTRYGLIPDVNNPPFGAPLSRPTGLAALLGQLNLASWENISMFAESSFGLYALGLLILTSVYLGNVNNVGLAHMFNGASFGYRIFFALLGSIIAFFLNRVQQDMQTLSPYMRLQDLNADPTSTILLRKRTLPITSFFPMIKNRHFTAAIVAFVALLAEFLIVTFSGVPYRPGQLRFEFLFCAISSLVILAIILLTLIAVNVWKRKLPILPRKPDSVAAVLTYVCHSDMVADFQGTEKLSVSERDSRFRKLGKKYGYGFKERSDGVSAWTTDQMGGSPFKGVRGAERGGPA